MPPIKSGTMDPVGRLAPAARSARRRSGLRTNSAAICVMLLVQYGLGMGVSLYASVPPDHGAGLAASLGRALTSQPVILAVHASLGLLMLVAAISVLTRAILARHRGAAAASLAGLAAIIAAAVSGTAFVSNGRAGSSMAMAVFTGVALLCYLANLLMTSTVTESPAAGPMRDLTTVGPVYHDGAGQASARFRPAAEPPGYRSAKGTAGHFLSAPADSGGRFSLYRWDMSPESGGPGPHFHRTFHETFYVLSGIVRLYDGTRWLDAHPGDMLYVPAGGIHGFTNTSGAPASMLMLLSPGADRAAYFAELARIAASGRELSDVEWAEVFARHDNVSLPDGDQVTPGITPSR